MAGRSTSSFESPWIVIRHTLTRDYERAKIPLPLWERVWVRGRARPRASESSAWPPDGGVPSPSVPLPQGEREDFRVSTFTSCSPQQAGDVLEPRDQRRRQIEAGDRHQPEMRKQRRVGRAG